MYETHPIFHGNQGWSELNSLISIYTGAGIFILVDENTSKYCLPLLKANCPLTNEATIIQTESGESNKTLNELGKVWQQLSDGKATRNSLLICLGGGVISDLGGFAAAAFKRGIDFINIPTSLLSMVDASLGGKTGINLGSLKNQIGVFVKPKGVFIFPEFLHTLPKREKFSGFAEMLKHAMIDSEAHFESLFFITEPEKFCVEDAIMKSAAVKMRIVGQDPSEGGIRKVLNFGHTIGHAIETFSQKNDAEPLLHGEAIAIGLICESYISMVLCGLSQQAVKELADLVRLLFPHYRFSGSKVKELLMYMGHDKKNIRADELNFSLLNKIGDPVWDKIPGERLIRESLHFYLNLPKGTY